MSPNENELLLKADGDVESGEDGGQGEQKLEDELQPSATFIFFRFHNMVGVLSLGLLAFAQALPPPHSSPYIMLMLQQFYILFACGVSTQERTTVRVMFIQSILIQS